MSEFVTGVCDFCSTEKKVRIVRADLNDWEWENLYLCLSCLPIEEAA